MRTSDKLLISVILGLLVIAGAALFVQANKTRQGFLEGKAPTDVTTNYILAFQEHEFERAYGYLSPQLPGYPKELKDFIRQVNTESYQFDLDGEAGYTVLSVESGEDWAIVKVEESRFSHNGILLNDRWSTTFTMDLELIEGEWKISGSDRFIAYCWTRTVCP